MKQKHPLKRLGVLLLAALLACSMIGTAFADATTGSIKIELTTDLGTSKEGVEFKLYKVGDWNRYTESWKLVDSLSSTSIDFSSLNGSSQWSSAAQTLANASGLPTATNGTTGNNGTLAFSSLDLGMYLVVQEGANSYGTIAPFLAALPVMGDNGYTNEVTCSPKASAFPEPEPTPTPTPTPGGSSSHDHNKRYPTTSAGAISPLPPVETPLPTTPATGTNTSPSQQPAAPTTSDPLPDEPQPTEPALPDEPTQPADGDTTQPDQQPQGDDAPKAKNGWILPTAAGVAAAAVVGGIVLFRKRSGKTQ